MALTLDKLKELYEKAGASHWYADKNAPNDIQYAAAACVAVPMLIEEVRQLREALGEILLLRVASIAKAEEALAASKERLP